MCGLIAATGKIESRYTIALGCLSEKRGDESAGVGWCVEGQIRVAKIAQNPLVAFPVTLAPAIRHAAKYAGVLIGHTRQATTGAVTDKNAHPFFDKETNITWAHNGIISNYQTFGTYEVDSQCLIEGIKKKDFKGFYGPIALVWIEEGKLHAFRKGNPLYRGFRHKGVYLASEEDMLAQIGCKRIKEIAEGQLYVWKGITLETVKRIPYNKTYTSYCRGPYFEGYDYPEDQKWKPGHVWDAEQRKYVPETFSLSNPIHKCHTHCARGCVGFDTWSRTVADKSLIESHMCLECKKQPAMITSDYCYGCLETIRYSSQYGD